MSVVVLFGSEMGTAESVADSVADVLSRDFDVSVYSLEDYDVDDLDPQNCYAVVCSTYGSGDLPYTAEPFFLTLDKRLPDLSGLRFAVFGLGDSVYDTTFNRAGDIVAGMFAALGAEQVGEHARHDASGPIPATDQGRAWAAGIAALLVPALSAQ